MCGIAGFCNLNTDYTRNSEYWHQILVDMRKSVSHRGRDNTGEYLRRNVGLGHTRLAIRDLCFGAQLLSETSAGKNT